MVQETVRAHCGLLFDYEAFGRCSIPITFGNDIHPPTSLAAGQASGGGNGTGTRGAVTKYQVDAIDVMQHKHDQLRKNPFWWIPEIPLTSYVYQVRDVQDKYKWVTKWR
jgi:hypothetical protein